MKKTRTYFALLALCAFAISTGAILSNNGKAGYAKSPGENSCTSCHSGGATTGAVSITSDMVDWQYVPGQTYNISITVSQTGMAVFGLCIEALNSANMNAGVLIAGTGTQIKTYNPNGRKCVTHVLNGGLSTNSHSFTFSWVAPAAGTGNVTFYDASVAGNNNGQSSGDAVYTLSQVATEKTNVAVDVTVDARAIQISPNPASDWVNITTTRNDIIAYRILDINGKEVINVATAPIFVAALPSGMYFLQAINKAERVISVTRWVKK